MRYTCKLCQKGRVFSSDVKELMRRHLFSEHREMSYGWTTTTAHVPDFDESVDITE
jgi:hypothetical protein